MKIEDGKGSGYIAAVDNENYLLTNCVTQSEEHHTNTTHQSCYNAVFQCANVSGAGYPIFYIKNEDDEDISFEGMSLFSNYPNGSGKWQYIEVTIGDTGTPVGGNTLTPVNLNAGSGKEADVTCQYANEITGITKGSIVERFYIASGGSTKGFNFDMDIILPKNTVLCLYPNTATSGLRIDGTLDFYFHC